MGREITEFKCYTYSEGGTTWGKCGPRNRGLPMTNPEGNGL